MSLYIDMKMILSVKCSGSRCRFCHWTLNLLEDAQRCDSWEYFPLERRHAVDSIDILEKIVFRIQVNFALPGRNRIISHVSHTEHRVGAHVSFGFGDQISLVAE